MICTDKLKVNHISARRGTTFLKNQYPKQAKSIAYAPQPAPNCRRSVRMNGGTHRGAHLHSRKYTSFRRSIAPLQNGLIDHKGSQRAARSHTSKFSRAILISVLSTPALRNPAAKAAYGWVNSILFSSSHCKTSLTLGSCSCSLKSTIISFFLDSKFKWRGRSSLPPYSHVACAL